MSARTEVQVLERGMSAPNGVRFSATSLLIDQADESTFIEAGAWLQRVEGCHAWWWGDYMVAYCAWKLARDLAENKVKDEDDEKEKARCTYTAQYAQAAGVAVETLQNWKRVAEYFPPHVRHGLPLTHGHHFEAMTGAGAGNHALAQQWLARARTRGWGTTDLRAAIRIARIKLSGPVEPLPQSRMQELYAFTRWARNLLPRVSRMDKSEASSIRNELEPAALLLTALDRRAGAGNGSIPPLKKSIAAGP